MHREDDSNHKDVEMIEHLDHLYGYAMILTRNKTDAEDLVQETYSRAVTASRSLQSITNMKGWLFVILRNIWFTQWRRRSASPEIMQIDADENIANLIVEPSKDPHAVYVSKLDAAQVREAIQQLPVLFREIIILREYEELSYEEIASVMDCPLGTVMSRLARARTKLRKLLASHFESVPDE
jgi:RNA polymerase sigma-70 factor (ECF subfamily)